jgi:hypothetical protein
LRRQGQAQAWTRWQNFIKSLTGKDAKTAVAEFIKAVNAIEDVHAFKDGNDLEMGANITAMEIKTQATNAEGILARHEHDSEWVREEMLNKRISYRAQLAAAFAERRTK